MYPDVGKEIKRWAKFLVVLMTLPAVLLGIVVFAIMATQDSGLWTFLGLLAGLAVGTLGYFFARLSYIILYAYGELTDCVSSIANNVGVKKGGNPVRKVQGRKREEFNKDGTPVVERKSDGSWECLFCGHMNCAGADWCEECGIQPEFK